MNEGRKAAWQMAGRWLCWHRGLCRNTSGGWSGRKQQREPRLSWPGWHETVSVSKAGMFILGLFSVYRLDVYVDLQIISHQLDGCQRVILISAQVCMTFFFVFLSSLFFPCILLYLLLLLLFMYLFADLSFGGLETWSLVIFHTDSIRHM